MTNNTEPPALISITFDDGLRCQFEKAIPILQRYSLPATFFLIANDDPILLDGYPHPDWPKICWGERDIGILKGAIQDGFEIGAHSVHHLRGLLDENPQLEAEQSKQWIESRLNTEIESYCYPFCHFTSAIKNAVIAAGYKQARWGAHGSYYPMQSTLDRFRIDCRYIGEHGAENVNCWIKAGFWHVLMFHGIGQLEDGWSPIAAEEFARQMKELASYRDRGLAEIVAFKDGAARWPRSLQQPGASTANASNDNDISPSVTTVS